MSQDAEQLRLLSIFHYVVGGMVALLSLFPLIHLSFGLMFILHPGKTSRGDGFPEAMLGWFFVIVAGIFILFGETLAILIITAGRFLGQRSHYTFCQVMAGVECIFTPFGTVLGVFTLIVLLRDSVKPLFTK